MKLKGKIAGLALVLMQPSVAAASCLNAPEIMAQDIQHFQMQVMVSGDRCFTGRAPEENLYNHFMIQFGPDIKKNQTVLKRYFQRIYGSRSVEFFDIYLTAMANTISTQTNYMPTFCDEISASLTQLLEFENMQEGHAQLDTPLSLDPWGTTACALPAYIDVSITAE